MSNDINNLDPDDIGLKQIMGSRFHDETKKPMVEPVTPRQQSTIKATDAPWEYVKPNWMDNLKACAKSVLLFGGLSVLVFYWQQAGLMAPSIAVPSMCVCTALAGLGCGKNIRW